MNNRISVITIFIISLFTVISLCTGCDSSEKDLELTVPKEAAEKAGNVIGTEYENLTLPDSIHIEPVGELYIVRSDYSKNCDKSVQADSLAKLMVPGWKYISSEEQDPGSITKRYENGEKEASVWYHDDSTFVFGRTEHSNSETLDISCRKYVVGRDDLSESYVLNGEQYSLDEAVKYAEKYASEKLMPFLPNDSEVKAEAVSVWAMENGNYWFNVLLKHYMLGCPVSTVGSAVMGEPYMRPEELIITFDGKEDICHIRNNYYSTIVEKTKVEKIITLDSALRHLEKVLAPGSNYNVCNISLEYCARFEDINATEFEYRPMWTLTVMEGTSNTVKVYPREVIYVDAINGDVCCFSEMETKMIF